MSNRAARFARRLAARRADPAQQPEERHEERQEERRADPPLTGEALDRRLRELGISADRRGPYRKRVRQP